MMSEKKKPTNIDEYIEPFPQKVREILQKVREMIHALAPDAVEAMSYGIPTFKLQGKNLVHFAGYQKHIGFYPTPSGIEHFADQLSGYESAKGSVKFPLNQPMPFDLIQEMVEFRIAAFTSDE
mgnify:FL=1